MIFIPYFITFISNIVGESSPGNSYSAEGAGIISIISTLTFYSPLDKLMYI